MELLQMIWGKPVREHDFDWSIEITESYKEEAVFDLSFESWEDFNQQGKGEKWAMWKGSIL